MATSSNHAVSLDPLQHHLEGSCLDLTNLRHLYFKIRVFSTGHPGESRLILPDELALATVYSTYTALLKSYHVFGGFGLWFISTSVSEVWTPCCPVSESGWGSDSESLTTESQGPRSEPKDSFSLFRCTYEGFDSGFWHNLISALVGILLGLHRAQCSAAWAWLPSLVWLRVSV